ncbi:MAG: hypothetical protein IH991_02200, partial [Planctomycetes bacterium]|nr:hypothetical protein [Planctomycetota bacterium]
MNANTPVDHYTDKLHGLMQAASAINSTFSFDDALQVITEQARLVIGAHQSVTNVLIGDW